MPSWPLILKDDPSVLFTSAGMQPLVPYFLGKKQPPAKRIVAVQKVFRATDIEEVGRDGYHQTFWEVVGNFGIGDYWKKDAMEWGWELLTNVFGIDTGAGLERITQVLQGVPGDVYRTDLFQPLVKKIESLSGKRYGGDRDTDVSIRIVAEHSRAATFLIADGVVPSNEFRGYVLRRLIRRAAPDGRRLGLKTGVLAALGGEAVT